MLDYMGFMWNKVALGLTLADCSISVLEYYQVSRLRALLNNQIKRSAACLGQLEILAKR
jgi:hypothetical protein